MEYKTVQNENLTQLIKNIKELMKEGWQVVDEIKTNHHELIFYQNMFRQESKESTESE